MFDLGWSELAVVALIALIVVGPKELPQILRTAAHWMRKARSLAREFQSSVDDMVREAELDEAKKTVESARHLSLDKEIEDAIDPTGSLKEEVAEVEQTTRKATKFEEGTPPEFREEEGGAEAPEPAGAKIIEQPAQPAPPHSIRPPAEELPAEAAATETEPAAAKAAKTKSA